MPYIGLLPLRSERLGRPYGVDLPRHGKAHMAALAHTRPAMLYGSTCTYKACHALPQRAKRVLGLSRLLIIMMMARR